MPGELSPEGMLANFLSDLSDRSQFWEEKIEGYSKQVCFRDYTLADILSCRTKAKKWYNQQLDSGAWGRQAANVYKYLLSTMSEDSLRFIEDFDNVYSLIR